MIANRPPLEHPPFMRLFLIPLALAFVAGCGGKAKGPGSDAKPKKEAGSTPKVILPAARTLNAPEAIKQAQPKLPTTQLLVGPKDLNVTAEVADSEAERNAGLMFRESLGKDEGMVFVFPRPQKVGFYMRNTTVKLSVAYIGSTGRIIELHDLEPLNESSVYSQVKSIQFVLEMSRGWFKENGVRIGHRVKTNRGELDEVLLPVP